MGGFGSRARGGTGNLAGAGNVNPAMTRSGSAAALCTVVCLVVVLAGCGGGGAPPAGPAAGPTTSVTTDAPAPSVTGLPGTTVSPVSSAPSASASHPPRATGTPPGPTSRPTTVAPPSTPGTALSAGVAGKDWERLPTTRKIVALTFDAGANADGVAPVLATLRRENVPATFFLTGQFAKNFPSKVQDIAAAGGRIGNHSATHPYFTKLTDSEIRSQVQSAEGDIRTATGQDPRPFFRFPYGDRNVHDIALLNELGYVPVRWTVDTVGWKGTSGGASVESVTTRVLNALTPGEIVLMHLGSHPEDHSTLDADALPGVIKALREQGYGFVTLDVLLG
ncbi:Peptidoglycan/xylan/chitin deacetylase, PgdA/CDA1 family [Parafrankia irregularis]|uniref:Peptidoglycan/xylan/chitin deacetylase, PgdA/CDA1 family n=1 Tax=Parafrankia irregularis TaxID=795642 RepID=A0A0S4QF92_9ACTN|nr:MULTISPECIES: polysaccharide deacetylase family protein [Parafrankia]MBE3203215.1 polysaccharide deacetylase family protein [Parafrankia sp. CH37]CUU54141.1 Peptidoglycan/xylan/chitin deacetylase, PgdA/CDA1 family [Parafrankia irregularis]